MNREKIIEMARGAGISQSHAAGMFDFLERFAAMVATAEREACAKVCDETGTVEQWDGLSEAADRIRARGQQ